MLVEFLKGFQDLGLLQPCIRPWGSDVPICDTSRFLACHFSESSKNDLALCDAGWWTAIYLTGTVPGAPLSSQPQLRKRQKLLGAIYCGIHKAMEVSDILKVQMFRLSAPIQSFHI